MGFWVSAAELFRLGNYTPIAPLGQSAQNQLQAAWIEFRIFLHALPFMQKDDGAGPGLPQHSLSHQAWLALDRIQPPDSPTDQGQAATRQFGMHKQILLTRRRPE